MKFIKSINVCILLCHFTFTKSKISSYDNSWPKWYHHTVIFTPKVYNILLLTVCHHIYCQSLPSNYTKSISFSALWYKGGGCCLQKFNRTPSVYPNVWYSQSIHIEDRSCLISKLPVSLSNTRLQSMISIPNIYLMGKQLKNLLLFSVLHEGHFLSRKYSIKLYDIRDISGYQN